MADLKEFTKQLENLCIKDVEAYRHETHVGVKNADTSNTMYYGFSKKS